jgi:ribonuclease HI
MKLDKSGGIALFSDGSCHHVNRLGGWAWIAIDSFDGEEVGVGHEIGTTNNRMEMAAWIEGLDSLFRSLGPCEVFVYSDSEYVGKGAMDKTRNRRKNVDLWLQIDRAVAQHEYVEFEWVKGHHESHYNDLVDKLAGEARQDLMRELGAKKSTKAFDKKRQERRKYGINYAGS